MVVFQPHIQYKRVRKHTFFTPILSNKTEIKFLDVKSQIFYFNIKNSKDLES